MSKQLPTDAIANELAGASAFFPKKHAQPANHATPEIPPTVAKPLKTVAIPEKDTAQSAVIDTPAHVNAAVVPAPYPPSTTSSNHEVVPPRHHDTMPPNMVEVIRKVVKQVGKEAATHRFTEEEKRKLADIVYTYERQGYRTSENEITRIAVNWLMWDYQEQGATSVLARLLKALHE